MFQFSSAAQPAGTRWSCHQGQKGRGCRATATAAGAYFALGEAVAVAGAARACFEAAARCPQGRSSGGARRRIGGVAAVTTGAAAFEGELAVALGACGGDMKGAFGGPFVLPDLAVVLPL